MPYNAPRSNRYPLSSYPGNEKEWRMRMWAYLAGTSMGYRTRPREGPTYCPGGEQWVPAHTFEGRCDTCGRPYSPSQLEAFETGWIPRHYWIPKHTPPKHLRREP